MQFLIFLVNGEYPLQFVCVLPGGLHGELPMEPCISHAGPLVKAT